MARNARGKLLGHSIGQIDPQEMPSWDVIYQTSTVKHPDYNVGDFLDTGDGRRFRLCKSGAAITVNHRGAINGYIIPGDSGAGYEGSLVTAAAVGDTVLTITDTESAANRPADYYVGGTLVAFVGTNFFTCVMVKSSVGDGTSIDVTIDASVPADISASVGITAYPSIYGNVKAGLAQKSGFEAFVVVPMRAVSAANTYFWGQTKGPTWITPNGGTWPGSAVDLRDVYFHVNGTIDPATIKDVGSLAPQRAGYLLYAGSSGSYGDALIMLQLE